MTESATKESSAKSRLAEELKSYAVISGYLFVCFSVILFYGASMSSTRPADAIGISSALVQALIIGKFVLIGEIFKPGSRVRAPTLLHRVAWRTLGMLLVLIVFKLIEELIVGAVHGQGMSETIDELARNSWPRLLAPTLMMTLILIPLMTAIELDRALGEGGLKDLLLRREP